MNVNGFGHSDIGRRRENNEDAFWIDDDLGAFVVCDGMGGHANGEQAARLAIDAVAGSIRSAAGVLDEIKDVKTEGHERLLAIALEAARAACRGVHAVASSDPAYHGMGCTLTLLVVADDRAVMAHIGDTRLYLQRDGGVDQLSSDHTMAADLVRQARLTPEAARDHRLSSALTRAVGVQEAVDIETLIFDLLPDDVLLLCSDGLSQEIESMGELAPYLSQEDVERAPRALVDLANERGGRDNITAVVVSVSADEQESLGRMDIGDDVREDLATLRSAELFAEIPLADLLRLYMSSEVRHFAVGESVLEHGAELDGLYCVLAGSVERAREEGGPRALRPGDCFGGPALLLRGVPATKTTAKADSRLLFVDGDPFRRLAASRPRLVLTLLSRIMQTAFTERGAEREILAAQPARKRKSWWNPSVWARASASRS